MWAALLITAADLAGSFTVSDRTEARVRAPGTNATGTAAASLDLETVPEARLTLASRRVRYSFSYAPRLTLWDVNAGAHPTWLNNGAARVEWHSELTRLSIDQVGSYGGVSFAYVSLMPGPEGAPPRVDAVPAPQIIQYASSTTTLASRVTLRRWAIDTSLGYRFDGGADVASRLVLPFQRGPFGEASLAYAASRIDHVVTTVAGSEAAFSSGPESVVTEIDEGYRHAWSRTTETRLTVGISQVRARTTGITAYTFETHPVAEVVLEERPPSAGGHVNVRIGLRVGPVVNRLLGIVDERVQGTLAAAYTYQRLTTHAFAIASQTVPPSAPYATELVSGELGAAYDVSNVVRFDVGVRGLWQRLDPAVAMGRPLPSSAQVAFLQGTIFAGVTLRAPPVRM